MPRSALPAVRLLLATLFVTGGACAAPTASGPASWIATVTKSMNLTSGHGAYSEPDVTVDGDRVRVTGFVRTGYICDNVSASVVTTPGRVTIRLLVTRHTGGCVTMGGEHTYVVEGVLRAGTHDLAVVLGDPGPTPGANVILDRRIVVE